VALLTRDVRLHADDLVVLRDLCRKRRQELQKRLERTSYDGKPGMKDRVVTELAAVTELERVMEHNRQQVARQYADNLLTR
jgi:hypothetical protein